jgi:hypothetical protein
MAGGLPRDQVAGRQGRGGRRSNFAHERRLHLTDPPVERRAPVKALNFYSSVYHGFLVSRDKTCTIRLGDKRDKYRDGDVVLVTYGDRFKPRKKVYTAVIDQVAVKKIRDLTPEDLQGENPEMRSPQDAVDFLGNIYKSPITLDSTVTVIHFSEIVE